MRFNQQTIFAEVSTRLSHYISLLESISLEPYCKLSLNSKEFRSNNLRSHLKKSITKSNSPVIYEIRCLDQPERIELINRYREFNNTNKEKDRGTNRLNISRFNNTDSETLYLGSSIHDFRTRINQHLGGGNFRTYSLQLSVWDNDLDYTLEIQAFKVKSNTGLDLDRNFIELVEQALWEYCKPVFGKKSGL